MRSNTLKVRTPKICTNFYKYNVFIFSLKFHITYYSSIRETKQFKKMNIKKINGAGHIKINNWQQRMELFGYRVDSIKKNDYLNGKKMDDSHLVSCSYIDYVKILKKRKFFWDSLEKMKKRFQKLPKNSFKKKLTNFLDNEGEKYYAKLFNL